MSTSETAFSTLRADFLNSMRAGRAVLHATGAKKGDMNWAETIKPFYFKSAKQNGEIGASNADGADPIAKELARRLAIRTWDQLKADRKSKDLLRTSDGALAKKAFGGQTCGNEFEKLVVLFLRDAMGKLSFLRPGDYDVRKGSELKDYAQYRHLQDFMDVLKFVPAGEKALRRRLSAALSSYAVSPDVVIVRRPHSRHRVEEEWKRYSKGGETLLGTLHATRTPFISDNQDTPSELLHAIVSAKWTLRSDRAQNARTEGAFSSRERRGHAPHVVVVTGESKPSRIRSLTEGPDVDCVYHFSLEDLSAAVKKGSSKEQEEFEELQAMNRLRDLTDLPFDLAT